jgi:hypothetical protein
MACQLIAVFFRQCGHVSHGMVHTQICNVGRQASDHRRQPSNDCWCPLPPIVKPIYCVGNCLECLDGTERAFDEAEPARHVYLGENAAIINPGLYSPRVIAREALDWRRRVEDDERLSLTETRRKREELIIRREQRRMVWNDDWADYRTAHRGEVLPKILDLTEETRGDDALLKVVQPPPAAPCPICRVRLDRPALGERRPNPRALECGHHMHRNCLAQALMHSRWCPVCRAPANFVLKSSNDDAKLRWDEEDRRWYQVAGFVPFQQGLQGRYFFEPYGDEDKWGNEA